MQVPLEISYRGVESNEFIEELIRSQVAKLERICSYITSCSVALEQTQEAQSLGNPFRVRIQVGVPPGHKLVVRREPSGGDLHEPLPKVMREAFEAMRRRIQSLVERQRAEVKTHPVDDVTAIVARLFRPAGYGFLHTLDGREIFFHRNSVVHDDFDRLEVGTGVWFVEQEGHKGPQASTVHIVDKPGMAHPSEYQQAAAGEKELDWDIDPEFEPEFDLEPD